MIGEGLNCPLHSLLLRPRCNLWRLCVSVQRPIYFIVKVLDFLDCSALDNIVQGQFSREKKCES